MRGRAGGAACRVCGVPDRRHHAGPASRVRARAPPNGVAVERPASVQQGVLGRIGADDR